MRVLLCLTLGLVACGDDAVKPQWPERPNVLWVVWDTVRADHLSLYGYSRVTTPRLDEFARSALVFDNAVSASSSTMPSHASMFTGLYPSEHGAGEDHPVLDPRHQTLAECLREIGYQTYLWAANPHLVRSRRFAQGFDLAEHPWSKGYFQEALAMVRAKVPAEDQSSELAENLRQNKVMSWSVKAAGRLAQRGVGRFLSQRDRDRPWLIFLNYMEAHRPFIPAREYRQHFMSEEQVRRSYQVDRSWDRLWAYVFGAGEYSNEEIEIMAATYDATLRELDDLFGDLLDHLRAEGLLDNTVVILTSDHGELLGEHHLMDHQYSLYSPLTRVPLVLHFPPYLRPGRRSDPVMSMDLFPTLLQICGASLPEGWRGKAVDLLRPAEDRTRLSEYPAIFREPVRSVRTQHPRADLRPLLQRLRAWHRGPYKLIEREDGQLELYDLEQDPLEQNNLARQDPELRERLRQELLDYVETLQPAQGLDGSAARPTAEELQMLEGLGYNAEGEGGDPPTDARGGSSSWQITDRSRDGSS
jgi:arylsulfatase A-like enzyme